MRHTETTIDAATRHGEPTAATHPASVRCYVLATRPAFLSVTLVGVLLGLASAWHDEVPLRTVEAALTLLFALAAHAGANVVNDFHDALNGTDAANTERVFPFTGGSRFIQNGVLSTAATARLGYGLLLAVIPAGLWLTTHSASGLLLIGAAGLLVGWAYSAPPLALASRGMGELAITAGWLLVVIGSDFVQRGAVHPLPIAAGIGFALLVANLLYINQFPDATADAMAGKRTLVVRLGRRRARWGYALIAMTANVSVVVSVMTGTLPAAALLALLALPLSIAAFQSLWHFAETPAHLSPAIKLTIAATHLHGLLLAVVLIFSKGTP
jgi:1,4-dihydroxy-2-naphthoate octaprenyltransferase